MIGLSFLNNVFGDTMIYVFSKTGLAPTEFLEMSFRALGTALLQRGTQGQHARACLLDSFTTKRFTRTICGNVHDTKINAEGPIRNIKGWFRYVKRNGQQECSVA